MQISCCSQHNKIKRRKYQFNELLHIKKLEKEQIKCKVSRSKLYVSEEKLTRILKWGKSIKLNTSVLNRSIKLTSNYMNEKREETEIINIKNKKF